MVNNKYIGVYKTDTEYDYRECLVLTYAIPTNKEFTEFDYDYSLIVDLRTLSQSIADYLRDLSQSHDALSFKTFMQFASTRKYQSREQDILSFLATGDYIRKVPATCVRLKFSSPDRGEYSMAVSEINTMIKEQLSGTAIESVVANTSEKWDASEFTGNTELVEVKEEVPFTERVVRDENVYGNAQKNADVEKAVEPTVAPTAELTSSVELRKEVQELKAQLSQLTEAVTALATKPKSKAGRPAGSKNKEKV